MSEKDVEQELQNLGYEFPEVEDRQIPTPLFFRVVVVKMAPKKQSAGGIVFSDTTKEAEDYAIFVGKVLRLGSMAFKGKMPSNGLDMSEESNAPKEGDYVLFGKYAGQKIELQSGATLILLSDDELTGTTNDPSAYRMYI